MDYVQITNNIMYQCKNADEVKEYLQSISESITLSNCADMTYQQFIDFASIYARICEQLEIHPEGHTVHFEGKKYDGKALYGNLKFARQMLVKYLTEFIQLHEDK